MKTSKTPQSIVRVSTAGSVDNGKSTLIGRLLYDCNRIMQDQIPGIENEDGEINPALLLDGLKSEREQGITIDVSYRYFSTRDSRIILADSPGHEQYTRNMATAASTADIALVLVDSKTGITDQTKRHIFIAHLFKVKEIIIVVNKMDLVGFSELVFHDIKKQALQYAVALGVQEPSFIPVSALNGDNVARKSLATPWYEGPTLLTVLEGFQPLKETGNFRFPVQMVVRPHQNYRGYSGSVANGKIAVA